MSTFESNALVPVCFARSVALSKLLYCTLYSSLSMPSFTLLFMGCDKSKIIRTEPSGFCLAPTGLQCRLLKGGASNGPEMCCLSSSLLNA